MALSLTLKHRGREVLANSAFATLPTATAPSQPEGHVATRLADVFDSQPSLYTCPGRAASIVHMYFAVPWLRLPLSFYYKWGRLLPGRRVTRISLAYTEEHRWL